MVGIEANISPADYPLIRLVPSRIITGKPYNNVVTQTLAAEGDVRRHEYVGGYSDWLEQRPAQQGPPAPSLRALAAGAIEGATPVTRDKPAATKLSYKESRELAQLPGMIEALEREQREITARISSPDYHRVGAAQMKRDGLRSNAIEVELAAAFDRWAALEARATALKPA